MTCSGMDLEGIEEDFSTRGLPPLPIIPCKSSRGELSFFIADHARDGSTYTIAKERELKKYKDEHGFYDGKEHE